MPSGGVFGRPKVFSDELSALELNLLNLTSPISGRATFAYSVRVKNTGDNPMNVYFNSELPISLEASEVIEKEMMVHRLAVESTAGTTYEVLAVLAA